MLIVAVIIYLSLPKEHVSNSTLDYEDSVNPTG
jgi:hypothetical protein